MKYQIHNLARNTYFIVNSFEEMIEYFARHNKPKEECVQFGSASWMRKVVYHPIDPKIHHYHSYNSALSNIAMNPNEHYTTWGIDWRTGRDNVEKHHRDILVKDEMGRTIDPRHYWNIIAVTKPKYRYSRYKKDHKYVYRHDPVPRTGYGKWHRGSYYRHMQTTQERRKAADPEIKQYVKPKRNFSNLPNLWDEKCRNRDHCWKAKKIKKQWMKHIKGA